jgi:hypothetical protein
MKIEGYEKDVEIAEDGHIKLDYTLETPEERNELVKIVIANTPPEKLSRQYLKAMSDYILDACKEDIKQHKIITKNRLNSTIKVRETSLEGLSASFENKADDTGHGSSGDYIYNLIIENDKNIILTPKNKITQEDIDNIPELKKVMDEIYRLETQVFPKAKGKQRFSVKENIKMLYKDAYVIRTAYKGAINCINATKSATRLDIYEDVQIDKDGELIINSNISLLNPKHVSALLCNY